MNVRVNHMTVTCLPLVPIQWEVTHVHVIVDIKETVANVQVHNFMYILFLMFQIWYLADDKRLC